MSKTIDLKAHIAALRKQEENKPKSNKADNVILFWGESADKTYLPQLKPCVGSATTFIRLESVTTLSQVSIYCHTKGITRVISTSTSLLKKLLHWDKRKAPSLSNYAGSYFTIPAYKGDGEIEVVFIAPLKQLVTVPFGRFMATRLVSKLTKPESWFTPTEFNGFDILAPKNETSLYPFFEESSLICIDIETFRENATIRCLSYTGFQLTSAGYISKSVVLPLDCDWALAVMRKWNLLPAAKILQNGKYDMAYLTRYNAPVQNYLYDTANLFHCYYSELPKDLGFLNSFFIRKAVYWKDLAETNDLYEYYRYNALDTWGTGNCFLAMMLELPEYAHNNYLLEFPLVFPCHLSEMTGIARAMPALAEAKAEQDSIIRTETNKLNTILDIQAGTDFNVNSPKQMKALLKILGCQDLPSADEKNLNKARFRHPFNARVISSVIKIRKARKLVSTYLTPGKEFCCPAGTGNRILYALNPHGTDTSRLASREHHFWCGLQVQNIPRGPAVKQTLKADDGFYMAEVDLEQAESRDTGYISGDEQLIHNVEHSPDFHKSNAAMFFGIPFEEVTKELRTLGKPVNHGANYNMGAFVLIDTMGEEMIQQAKVLLGLNKFWSYKQVAEYLLEQFHKVYPDIKGVFYKGVVEEILTTSKLSSKAVHHSWTQAAKLLANFRQVSSSMKMTYPSQVGKAWVRHCFSDPTKSKSALNAYIAHPPQSLNAQTLNKAYLSVFHDIAINPEHSDNFKLMAQIHDSILFQYRIGHEYLCDMVKERMEVPVTIRAYDGKVRTFVVPAGVKSGKHLDKQCAEYWSETE